MPETISLLLQICAVGIGATAIMDLWALLQKRAFGIPSLDYRLVGRWAGHFPHRKFFHHPIGNSHPVRHERTVGWGLHYLIGILLAGLLVLVAGPGWLDKPTLGPPLLVGLASVLLPFCVLQPAFGLGIAGTRTPHPGTVRRRSFVAHLSFGLGLYLAGEVAAWLF